MRKLLVVLLMLTSSHGAAQAWGGKGHRIIGELAARNFPASIPAFLKTPQAQFQIGQLAREPDISRGAGQPHDWDLDPGHFVDLDDQGKIMGGPALPALPASRRDYDTALRTVGSNQYAAGYLPYNLMGGWQQLVKDFAILRMTIAAQKHATKFSMTRAERERFTRERALREMLTLRDLGWWAHFVGDASQPLHTSIHYDGWGEGPNPRRYITAKGLHAKFETDFVDTHISEPDVAARLRPYRACNCTVQRRVQDYLTASWAELEPTYQLDKDGAFDRATPASIAFTAARIAEAASQLRDLVADAWVESGEVTLGYKTPITVKDLESGRADPRALN
jgi:hypothetical protein